MRIHRHNRLFSHALVCALLSTSSPALFAQPDSNPPVETETVVLSPFTVSTEQDTGYIASASLSGGRLNTPLKETAASVSVLTRELLDDIAANNFQDAAEWSVSARSNYINEPNPFNDYGITFRNLAGGYNSRNYFRWYVNSDSFLTERYDLARGPNSIVFGDSGIGGSINVASKRARLGRQFSELQVRWRDLGGLRVGLDHNQPLGEKAAVRAVLLRQEFDEWQDRTRTDFDGLLLTGEWRPFRNTTVWGEFEYGEQERVVTNRPADQFTRWDGSTAISAPITSGNFPGGIGRHTSERQVFVPGNPGLGVVNWRNWGNTGGTGIRLAPDAWSIIPSHPTVATTIPDYATNFVADNAVAGNEHKSYSLFVEQQIGDRLFLEAAANYFYQRRDVNNSFYSANQQVDVNRLLPNGQDNPYFGQSYVDFNIAPQLQSHDQLEYRANLAYLFDTSFADFRALVGYTFRDDVFKVKRFKYNIDEAVTGNLNIDAPINQLYLRRYESELGLPLLYPSNAVYVERGSQITNRQSVWRSWQGVLSGRWFEGRRLTTLVGYRRDNITNDNRPGVADPVTQRFFGWGPGSRNLDETVDNWNLSAIYQLTDSLGIYASKADSYDFSNAATDINGTGIPPIISSGWETGLRFELLDGRLVGSVAYYSSEQDNRRESGASGDINTIWEQLTGQTDVVPNYSDTSSWKGDGFEFEAIANLTDGLRLTFNIAFPQAEQGVGFLATKAYFDENLPAWQNLLAQQTDPTIINTVNQRISAIRNRFEGYTEGRVLNNSYDYTANILGSYSFRQGAFKGLGVGGGVNFRGERLVGNRLGDPYDYLYADAYATASAWVSYGFTVFDHPLRLQLNVSNLFDDQEMQPTSGGFGNVTVNGATQFTQTNYTVIAPRTFTLTATYKF